MASPIGTLININGNVTYKLSIRPQREDRETIGKLMTVNARNFLIKNRSINKEEYLKMQNDAYAKLFVAFATENLLKEYFPGVFNFKRPSHGHVEQANIYIKDNTNKILSVKLQDYSENENIELAIESARTNTELIENNEKSISMLFFSDINKTENKNIRQDKHDFYLFGSADNEGKFQDITDTLAYISKEFGLQAKLPTQDSIHLIEDVQDIFF